MEKLAYCAATEEDIPFINETYLQNIDSLHGNPRTVDTWKALLSVKGHAYYIVKADSSVGWFRTDIEDGEFWLGMLQVKPIYHHRGIGKYILSVAEDMAKAKGYKSIGVHTTEDNIPARTLYQSAGYSVTEIGPCTTADGEERVGYTFQKELCV